jgi:hypothetical protein
MNETDPERIRQAAGMVRGKYRTEKSHDKHPDNPFGHFSADYYQTAMAYADALETEDEAAIESQRAELEKLMDQVERWETPIRGMSTGLGQAISTPDRSTSIDIRSIDAKRDNDEGRAFDLEQGGESESWIDAETVRYVLDIAINEDLSTLVAKSPKYSEYALVMNAKKNKDGSPKIGGPMTVNELRYVIRSLGRVGANYPGRDKMRSNTHVPRDARKWWLPGEDPEIEPLPTVAEDGVGNFGAEGGQWNSIWKREGYPTMGPTAIGQEMADEVKEFDKLGIASARAEKVRSTGVAMSKVAVTNTNRAAGVKLSIIADIYRGDLGVEGGTHELEKRSRREEQRGKRGEEDERRREEEEASKPESEEKPDEKEDEKPDKDEKPDEKKDESTSESLRRLIPIVESMDRLDRQLVVETCEFMRRRLDAMLAEDAPPGWKGTVKAMKQHSDKFDADADSSERGGKMNPFAVAWSMHKKGAKPSYKDKEGKPEKKESSESMMPMDSIDLDPEG